VNFSEKNLAENFTAASMRGRQVFWNHCDEAHSEFDLSVVRSLPITAVLPRSRAIFGGLRSGAQHKLYRLKPAPSYSLKSQQQGDAAKPALDRK
jgi:hypothetical protein